MESASCQNAGISVWVDLNIVISYYDAPGAGAGMPNLTSAAIIAAAMWSCAVV